jgi:hypothetical protein
MSGAKLVGITVAVMSWGLHIASYRGRQLRTALIAAMVVPVPVGLVAWFVGKKSVVDPLAGWWGIHTTWKIALAATMLFMLPIGAFFVSKLLAQGRVYAISEYSHAVSHAAPDGKTSDTWHWSCFFGPYMVMFAISIIMVLCSFIAWPSYPTSEHIRWAIDELGFNWVQLHPTPAIHHTYATASFYGVYLVYGLWLFFARAAVGPLASLLGDADRVKLLSFLVNAAGSALAWFS